MRACRANWGQASATINDGTVDAVVLPELFPSGRMVQLGAAGSLTAWSLPKDIWDSEGMKKFAHSPGLAPWTMTLEAAQTALGDSFTVVSEDDTFRGLSTIGGDTVNKDMDEEMGLPTDQGPYRNPRRAEGQSPLRQTRGLWRCGFGKLRHVRPKWPEIPQRCRSRLGRSRP